MNENPALQPAIVKRHSTDEDLARIRRTAMSAVLMDQSTVSIANLLLDHVDELLRLSEQLNVLREQLKDYRIDSLFPGRIEGVSGGPLSTAGVEAVVDAPREASASDFLRELLKQTDPRSPEAVIRAAANVILPPGSCATETRRKFLELAEAIEGIEPF